MAATSSCIVLIEDLKISGVSLGVSAFGRGEAVFGASGWGRNPCAGGLGGGVDGGIGDGPILSFMGKLAGIGPGAGLGVGMPAGLSADKAGETGPPADGVDPVKSREAGTPGGLFDGVVCWPIGDTLICGLIGLGESDGLIGSGICEIV